MPDFFSFELLIALAAIFVASFMQSITGFGLAIIATPLLLISYDAKLVVVILQFVALCSNSIQSVQLFKNINLKLVLYLTLGALIGQPLGLFIYGSVSNATLKLIVSAAILVFLVLMRFFNARIPENNRNSAITGFLSGVLATTTGMSGPPLVMYLAYSKQEPAVIRATCVLYFCLVNITSLGGFYLTGEPMGFAFSQAVLLLPGLVLGLIAGSFAFKHVSAALFRQLIFGMLFISCFYTIFTLL